MTICKHGCDILDLRFLIFELSGFNQNSTTELFSMQYHNEKINTLFASLGHSGLGKTVPSVLHMALGNHTQDFRAQFYPIWTSRPTNNISVHIYYIVSLCELLRNYDKEEGHFVKTLFQL